MFFNKKGRKIIHAIWVVLSVLIIISMTLLYMPAFFA
jgi:hypothetical protein